MAETYGWRRDLSGTVRRAVAKGLLAPENPKANPAYTTTEEETIKHAAERGITLVRQHQRSIGRAHRILEKLLDEAERLSDGEVEEPGEGASERQLLDFDKATSLPARMAALRDSSVALRNLIPLERQAFGLDAGPGEDPVNVILSADDTKL